MAKKNENEITLAYCPVGECLPIAQEVPETAVKAWIEGILGTNELTIKPTVLSDVYMICKKNDDDERFNWIGSNIYLFNKEECIGGDVFLCRIEMHGGLDGKVRILGLTAFDIERISNGSQQIFKNHKRLDVER